MKEAGGDRAWGLVSFDGAANFTDQPTPIRRRKPPADQTNIIFPKFVGNTAYISTNQSTGFTTGDGLISKPIASYALSLIDVQSRKIVWKADGQTSGGVEHSYADLAASTGRTAITRLISDGLIQKKK